MAAFAQIVAPIRQFWSRRTQAERATLIGVLAIAAVSAGLFLKLGSARTYVTAFTNLDPKDSAAIVDQLTAQKISYQVTPDGTSIRVPPDRLADARLKLAAKGLPQGGAVGFELFDKTSFGVTDFVQNVNYQRALEGELMRTINTLDEVEGSRVSIVVPKQALFISEQAPATASVLLRLRPGRTLTADQLRGLSHLVARSVEGLDEKNITIVDGSGAVLFDGGAADDTAGGLSATQMDTERHIEQGIQTELQTLLDRVVGPNRGLVRVKTDLDFSQGETDSESYAPGGANGQPVARSSSTIQETYNGAGLPGGQVPGATANLPALAAAAPGATPGAGTAYQRTETTTNNELTKTTEKVTRTPGTIKRLSVSVILDNSISEQDASGLHDAMAAAAGIDTKRGDQLVITTAALSGNQQNAAVPVVRPSPLDSTLRIAKIAGPVLLALMVLVVVWRMSRSVSRTGSRTTVIEGALALPPGQSDAAAEMAGILQSLAQSPADSTSVEALPAGESVRLPAPSSSRPELTARRAELRERLNVVAATNPEAVAAVVRSWMTQDRGGH